MSAAHQLAASGAGTISISAGSFDTDWPGMGFCRIETSAGALKEIVYYSSRTATELAVPAAGRSLLGTTAAAGAATDKIYPVPGLRIAVEAPSAQPGGYITDKTTAGEGSIPTETWSSAITQATGLSVGTLAAGEQYGVWVRRAVVVGHVAATAALNRIRWSFDAA